MRFMMLLKADRTSESGALPNEAELTAMGEYNDSLIRAGILLTGEGLHPSSRGARVRFAGGKRSVVDGPFAETRELIAGFWLIQVRSLEEAVEWASRVPFAVDGPSATAGGVGEIELRQVVEAEDFGPGLSASVPGVFEAERKFREGSQG